MILEDKKSLPSLTTIFTKTEKALSLTEGNSSLSSVRNSGTRFSLKKAYNPLEIIKKN